MKFLNILMISAVLSALPMLSPSLAANDEAIIGIINWRGAIFSTEEAKREERRIERAIGRDTERVRTLETQLTKLRTQIEEEGEFMNEEQQQEILAEIQEKLVEYQTLGREVERRFQTMENEFVQKQSEKMVEIVEKIAEERNLHVVVSNEAVVYGRLTLDITDDVIAELNGE